MDPDFALRSAVEHTLLAPDASAAMVESLVREAHVAGLFGVCVASARVGVARAAAERLGSGVRIVTVVGFPNGAVPTEVKVAETRSVVLAGAHEIDVVAHLGALRDGDLEAVRTDLGAVAAAADGRPVKVILETGLLTDAEKRALGLAALSAGATFLKTSTGIPGRGGATVEDVALLRALGPHVRVKASGGIRHREAALALLAAGAERLGTSVGPRLLRQPDVG